MATRSRLPAWLWPLIGVVLFAAIIAVVLVLGQQRVREQPGFAIALDSVSRSAEVQALVGTPVVLSSSFVQSDTQVRPEGELVFYRFSVRGDRGERTVRVLLRETAPISIVALQVE